MHHESKNSTASALGESIEKQSASWQKGGMEVTAAFKPIKNLDLPAGIDDPEILAALQLLSVRYSSTPEKDIKGTGKPRE